MEDRETTIRSRELGEGLRAAMCGAGLSGRDTARKLGWSPGRVSRLLSGKRGGTEMDVVSFLAVCEVKGAERDRLLRLCQEMSTPGWLQQHGDRLPKQLRTLIDHEDKAVSIGQFQPVIVPGLLQTGDYARALIVETGNVPTDEIEDRVAARLARQSLFSRRPPVRFTFFLHEFVLCLPVGGREVMSDQLHHLLRISVRPHVTLRVVPADVGGHAGIAGPFQLMEFTEFKPVVYLDSETSSLFLEEPPEIAAYRRVLNGLADKALDAGQSRELIAALATELYPSGEDRDEQA
jgi:transcriptional regulator with XRE-family HTH domain